jgi:hypothetical protein
MANEDSRIIQAQFSEMNNEQIADKIAADLAEARGRLRLLAEHLPTPSILSRSQKPRKLHTLRYASEKPQAWRVEEFGRAACDMLQRGDLVVGISNVRHAVESCAAVW